MKKKIMIGIAVTLFSVFALANSSFAAFDAIHMTDADGSTTVVGEFGWNEKPWLYLDLPKSFLNVAASWWESPATKYYFAGTGPGSASAIWISLDGGEDSANNPITWNGVKALGDWNVNASAFYADGTSDSGSTDFTVTPEPVSSVLFLVGGISLAASFRYKRRKRNY